HSRLCSSCQVCPLRRLVSRQVIRYFRSRNRQRHPSDQSWVRPANKRGSSPSACQPFLTVTSSKIEVRLRTNRCGSTCGPLTCKLVLPEVASSMMSFNDLFSQLWARDSPQSPSPHTPS